MFFGALSTDIKKSSTLWANLPQWMQTAVRRTNNITEYIINNTKVKEVEQYILPNSPEGDAWTVFYKCKDEEKLKSHVQHVAQFLKYVYSIARTRYILKADEKDIELDLYKKDPKDEEARNKRYEFVLSEKFYNAIYVRIGVAFDDMAPIKYKYDAKTPDKVSYPYNSYWESVIRHSERAEEQAPWESGIGVTQPGEKVKAVEAQEDQQSFYKEFDETEKNGEIIRVNIQEFALDEKVYGVKKYDVTEVNGYMVFVHYHLHVTMEQVKKNPHLYDALLHEFNLVHKQTIETMNDVFDNQAYLVKVKRSADSMIYLEPTITPSKVWNNCLSLCAGLPEGSSIGIAFTRPSEQEVDEREKGGITNKATGVLKRLTSVEKNRNGVSKVDYFGDCVNLSARMDTLDWKYETTWFSPKQNDHKSRVAMCNADQKNAGWGNWTLRSKQGYPGGSTSYIRPFLIEDIPRETLNAGKKGEVLRVISAHVYLGQSIQAGDEVYWEMEEEKDVETVEVPRRKTSIVVKRFNVEKKKKVNKVYYGRVLRVNFLVLLVEPIPGKAWPEDWVDSDDNPESQFINISYVKKCPTKKLQPIADKLDPNEKEKPHINKRLMYLKF